MGGDGFWFCFRCRRENRLTSVCFSSAIHGGRLLSFACPKESNQRKRHPRIRAPRCARGSLRADGFDRQAIHGLRSNRRDPSRRPRFARLVRPPFAASQRGEEQGLLCWTQIALTLALSRKRERGLVALRLVSLLLLRQGLPHLALPGPLSAAASRRRISRDSDGRQDAGQFDVSTWTYCRRTPQPARVVTGHGCPVTATARVSFLWLLSFGQAKESNRRPGMADETHTDVSRLSQHHNNPRTNNPIPTPPSP